MARLMSAETAVLVRVSRVVTFEMFSNFDPCRAVVVNSRLLCAINWLCKTTLSSSV